MSRWPGFAGHRAGHGRNRHRMTTTSMTPAQGGLLSLSGRQWLILLMVQLAICCSA